MSKGADNGASDKSTDKVETKSEKGSEAEEKAAAESQPDATKLARREGMEKALAFDRGDTMRGLVRQDGAGAKFEITGLEVKPETIAEKKSENTGAPVSDKSAVGDPPESDGHPGTDKIQRNPDGKVSNVTYPDGSSRDFEYGNDGTVKQLTYKDASGRVVDQWRLGDDGKYHQYTPDATGNLFDSGNSWEGAATVDDKSGDLTYEEAGSDQKVTERAASGATVTESSDGSARVENADGTGHERVPSPDGGYTESHWGPAQKDNYEITKTAEGKYLVADAPGATPREVTDDSDPRVERAELMDQAREKITDPEKLREFEENIQRFEERAKEQGLSPEEVAKTLHEISRIMETDKDAKIPEAQRIELAQQVMRHAADPATVDQGYHNTCNVASLESRMYSKDPSAVAQMIADVSHDGKYTTPTGVTVELPAASLKPDQEAKNPDSDDRSHASQLFQTTAVNIHYRKNGLTDEKGKEYPPGTVRYEQREATPGRNKDTGERLVDTSKDPPKVIKNAEGNPISGPHIGEEEVTGISNEITGRHEENIAINHADRGDNNTIAVGSEQEFKDELAKAKAEGRLPIMIVVNTQNEPFYSDSGAGSAGGSGGWHMINVTDYDPATGRVTIDNQWGESADHTDKEDAIDAAELYVATRDPEKAESMEDLKADIARKEAAGEPHPIEDVELLRRQYEQGEISAKELTDAMMKAAIDFYTKATDANTSDEDKAMYKTAWGKLADIAEKFPEEKYKEFDWEKFNKDFTAATAAIAAKAPP